MKKIKTKLISLALLIFTFILSFSMFGCEEQRTKAELIEFDKQYYNMTEETQQELDNLSEELKKFGSTIDYATEGSEYINIIKKQSDLVERRVNGLNVLKIPESMDEFYRKKIQQWDSLITANSIIIHDFDIWESNSLTTEVHQQNQKEIKEVTEKEEKLYWECDKIRREVYRKYDLDDLLTKYQE